MATGAESQPLESGPLERGPLQHRPLEPGSLEPGPLERGPLDRARHHARIVWRTSAANLRGRLEYPADFAFNVLFGILWQLSTLAFAGVLITRFSGLGGFPAAGVLLLVGIRMLSHGCYTLVFGNISYQLATLIEEGRLDSYFLRPVPVLTQVLISRLQINGFGDLSVGVTMTAVAVSKTHLHWTLWRLLFLIAAVVGGVFLEAAIQLPFSCLLLRSPAGLGFSVWVDEIMGTIANYPLSILPIALRGVFTFVLPVAFVAYLPATVLLGVGADHGPSFWLARLSPLAGFVLFPLAKRWWNRSLRHYCSTGG